MPLLSGLKPTRRGNLKCETLALWLAARHPRHALVREGFWSRE